MERETLAHVIIGIDGWIMLVIAIGETLVHEPFMRWALASALALGLVFAFLIRRGNKNSQPTTIGLTETHH